MDLHAAGISAAEPRQPTHPLRIMRRPSNVFDVLKRSSRPVSATAFVFARSALSCASVNGWNVRAASSACSNRSIALAPGDHTVVAAERVMQAFDRAHQAAARDLPLRQRFIPDRRSPAPPVSAPRSFEAPKMRVRTFSGIWQLSKWNLCSAASSASAGARSDLVSCEPMNDFARCLACSSASRGPPAAKKRSGSPAGCSREAASGHTVRLQPLQRLVDLSCRRFLGAAVELRLRKTFSRYPSRSALPITTSHFPPPSPSSYP